MGCGKGDKGSRGVGKRVREIRAWGVGSRVWEGELRV